MTHRSKNGGLAPWPCGDRFVPTTCVIWGSLMRTQLHQVRSEAWPVVRDADELHDVLLSAGAMPESECDDWLEFLERA